MSPDSFCLYCDRLRVRVLGNGSSCLVTLCVLIIAFRGSNPLVSGVV